MRGRGGGGAQRRGRKGRYVTQLVWSDRGSICILASTILNAVIMLAQRVRAIGASSCGCVTRCTSDIHIEAESHGMAATAAVRRANTRARRGEAATHAHAAAADRIWRRRINERQAGRLGGMECKRGAATVILVDHTVGLQMHTYAGDSGRSSWRSHSRRSNLR